MTLDEVAEELGVTREYVRQEQTAALLKVSTWLLTYKPVPDAINQILHILCKGNEFTRSEVRHDDNLIPIVEEVGWDSEHPCLNDLGRVVQLSMAQYGVQVAAEHLLQCVGIASFLFRKEGKARVLVPPPMPRDGAEQWWEDGRVKRTSFLSLDEIEAAKNLYAKGYGPKQLAECFDVPLRHMCRSLRAPTPTREPLLVITGNGVQGRSSISDELYLRIYEHLESHPTAFLRRVALTFGAPASEVSKIYEDIRMEKP